MCGIAGLLSRIRDLDEPIRHMTQTLRHRGPDDDGRWVDQQAGVALGHRRLSIVDLSDHGHQPMISHDGRYVMAFNGEIYNHRQLRRTVDMSSPRCWRGHSDSETLLEAIATMGLTKALQQSVGMFALAVWDRDTRRLLLARDRFGEKPLYYGQLGEDFIFGSELKAIRAHPDFAGIVDREALRLFASRGYVPAPLSIYQGVCKLEPGTILTVTGPRVAAGGARVMISSEPYWLYREMVEKGYAAPFADRNEAIEVLEETLIAAVREQSVADVPVGTFLSGGIDSSLIVALSHRHCSADLQTYSIGFEEPGFDEAPYARRVAQHLGTRHTEHYVTSAHARDIIPLLGAVYDEPFADPSQIPSYLLSKLARQNVKVALSGNGADELFGGYPRYATAARTWQMMRYAPRRARHVVGAALHRIPAAALDRLAQIFLAQRAQSFPGFRLHRTFHRLREIDSLEALYRSFRDEWTGQPQPVIGTTSEGRFALDLDLAASAVDRMMYCDTKSYLPDDILCKVDRAAMAHGLEVRSPFLDHRVAQVAVRLPLEMKMRGASGKLVLKELLRSYFPEDFFDRPKAGFSVPIGAWLRGPLRSWAEDLLGRVRLDREGFFDGTIIERRWHEHLAGRQDATHALWPVLMFQTWCDNGGAT